MPARLTPTVPRVAALAVAALLSTATIGLAADERGSASASSAATPARAQPLLKVPDVRGQAYVFVKGMLEDAGFAWRVAGPVGGFAANVVATQWPAPGTRVVDTGKPTLTLKLSRSPEYAEQGAPENASPYIGSAIRMPSAKPKPASKPAKPAAKPKPASNPAKPAAKPKPARVRPKATPKKKPTAPAKAKPKKRAKPVARPAKRTEARPRAFVVPGAPKEPLDEITLPARARKLESWVARRPKPTDANVGHWLYQHAWIVTGAKFGWWRGAEALRTLVRVDNRVIELWGIGSRSRAQAKAALREVEAKSR